ncbi:MAG: hypothetical protein ACRDTP_01230 [Mycobacteriales bacterium]
MVFTWDSSVFARFWMVADYFPQIAVREAGLPDVHRAAAMLNALGRSVHVEPVPVPADCSDGFGGAYWSQPEALLDPAVGQAMSGVAMLDPAVRERALTRLRADLASGVWHQRHGHLLGRDELDVGVRLLVATPA